MSKTEMTMNDGDEFVEVAGGCSWSIFGSHDVFEAATVLFIGLVGRYRV